MVLWYNTDVRIIGKNWLVVAITLIGTLVVPLQGFAQETPTSTNPQQAQILEQARQFLGDVNAIAEQSQQASTGVEQALERSGWKETLGKVWQGIKEFFNDKNARDLLVDTIKLFFRLLANIFLLIGGVIQKVLQAFGS